MAPAPARKLPRGALIAVEGIDGTGKSTQVARVVARLRAEGWSVVETREPTAGEWGKRIRAFARKGRGEVAPEDELDWFLRDRVEDVKNSIEPGLRLGKVVVTDRYYFSNMAYQGALGIDPDRIKEMNEALFPRPDLVLILEAAPAVGMDRIAKNRPEGAEASYEQASYLGRVAEKFAGFRDPSIRRVDAAATPDLVHMKIWEIVVRMLEDLARQGQA